MEKTASFGSHHLVAISLSCLLALWIHVHILETATAVAEKMESTGARLYRRTRRWGEYRLLCFAVLPSSTANNSSNICFSLCDFFLLSTQCLFSVLCFILFCLLFIESELELRQWKMSFIMISTFLPLAFELQQSIQNLHTEWISREYEKFIFHIYLCILTWTSGRIFLFIFL